MDSPAGPEVGGPSGEVEIRLTTQEGAYRFDARALRLEPVRAGDFRALTGTRGLGRLVAAAPRHRARPEGRSTQPRVSPTCSAPPAHAPINHPYPDSPASAGTQTVATEKDAATRNAARARGFHPDR